MGAESNFNTSREPIQFAYTAEELWEQRDAALAEASRLRALLDEADAYLAVLEKTDENTEGAVTSFRSEIRHAIASPSAAKAQQPAPSLIPTGEASSELIAEAVEAMRDLMRLYESKWSDEPDELVRARAILPKLKAQQQPAPLPVEQRQTTDEQCREWRIEAAGRSGLRTREAALTHDVLLLSRMLAQPATPSTSPTLREAARFYANEDNWEDGKPIRWMNRDKVLMPVGWQPSICDHARSVSNYFPIADGGDVARAALAQQAPSIQTPDTKGDSDVR